MATNATNAHQVALSAEVEEAAGVFPGEETKDVEVEVEEPVKADIVAKADPESDDDSSSSSESEAENEFAEIESELDLIEDPIRAWDLYTKPNLMGMPATYLAVGVIYGGQSGILYPLYQLVLEEPQNYQNAISSITAVFWSFKIFYGFLSDSVPIFGYRRKPYILGGWFFSVIMTALQAIYLSIHTTKTACFFALEGFNGSAADPEEHVFFSYDDVIAADATGIVEHTTITQEQLDGLVDQENFECNVLEPFNDVESNTTWTMEVYYKAYTVDETTFNGNTLIGIIVATNLMYMFADVAADGLAVEYAKREPYNERGRIQSYNYVCRFITTTFTIAISGFALNTPLYGGPYKAGFAFSDYMWFLTAGQAIFLPFWVIMYEEKTDPKLITSISSKFAGAWKLLQNKAFCALMVFNVMFNCFTSVSTIGSNALANYWVNASALEFNFSLIIQYIAITLTVYINGKYFVTYSWRCLQSFGLITSSIMGLLSLIVIYDINRSPGFWIFTQVDATILSMIGWLTSIWATNEMAPRGLEGTALAISTSSGNAAQGLATFFRNNIGAYFPNLSTSGADQALAYTGTAPDQEAQTRDEYTYNLLVVMAVNLFALVFMWLLPHQKAQARRRYETWGSSTPYGFLGLVIICVAMFYGTSTSIYTMFCPCDDFVGGPGCKPGTCEYLPSEAEAENTTNSTLAPTLAPTFAPTLPTAAPTLAPTLPTAAPTLAPTLPTAAPTLAPTVTV
mmetsp:Transcript_20789/g.38685  ORF Transcript_20789/g.38685 Transcript_20789/m.38685 type:complete len:738 (+) Transcript_20789:137-2350(+)